MDLAKIRKKSLQDPAPQEYVPVKQSKVAKTDVPAPSPAVDNECMESLTCQLPCADTVSKPVILEKTEVEAGILRSFVMQPATLSPLEVLLAGRVAAGCDDENQAVPDDSADQYVQDSALEFLCFRVSDEFYGINIMDIKEIIKPREVTDVPRAPGFVLGVISLRGTIIPVIDMRIRLGLALGELTGKERIVVIKQNGTFSGLLVDEVIQVVQIADGAIETAPTIFDGIDRDFISGIGRTDGRMMIILNLENISDIHLY